MLTMSNGKTRTDRLLAARYGGVELAPVEFRDCSQVVMGTATRELLIGSGLISHEEFGRALYRTRRGSRTFNQYGDRLNVWEACDGLYRVMVHSGIDTACADGDNGTKGPESQQIQAWVNRMLRPFVKGTWRARAAP